MLTKIFFLYRVICMSLAPLFTIAILTGKISYKG